MFCVPAFVTWKLSIEAKSNQWLMVEFDPAAFTTITVEISDHVCWVTLNRPEAMNAFDAEMQAEVQATWRAPSGAR